MHLLLVQLSSQLLLLSLLNFFNLIFYLGSIRLLVLLRINFNCLFIRKLLNLGLTILNVFTCLGCCRVLRGITLDAHAIGFDVDTIRMSWLKICVPWGFTGSFLLRLTCYFFGWLSHMLLVLLPVIRWFWR